MKIIFNTLRFIFVSVFITFLHFAISYLLPAPFNYINIVILSIVVSIIGWESGVSIWLAALLGFLLELYSISPFGLQLLPGTFSAMVAYWLYIFMFTNRSWWSTATLTAITIFTYRVLYTLAFAITEYLNKGSNISWGALISPYLWEIFLTSTSAGLIVYIFSKIWKRFNLDKNII